MSKKNSLSAGGRASQQRMCTPNKPPPPSSPSRPPSPPPTQTPRAGGGGGAGGQGGGAGGWVWRGARGELLVGFWDLALQRWNLTLPESAPMGGGGAGDGEGREAWRGVRGGRVHAGTRTRVCGRAARASNRSWFTDRTPAEDDGPFALTPNTAGLIPTLVALLPRDGPV